MNKIIKTITSLVCVFVFTLTSVQALFFEDIKDNKYEKDIQMLCNLGIVNGDESGNFNPDKAVSRVEFLTIVLRALYNDEKLYTTAGDEYAFDDVPKEHWAYHEVCFMRLMKMTEGVGNNLFDPTATISLNDAIKIIVSALEYQDVAESQGGYPDGYLKIASSIGLMRSAVAQNSEAMTRAEVAHLVAGALEIEDNNPFSPETILERRDFALIDGTVDSVYALQMGRSLMPGQIQIGGSVYDTNIKLLPCPEIELVGRRITAYYSPDYDAIVHIDPRGEQDVLLIHSDDIVDTPSISQYKYENANGKIKTVKIENGVVIYNGELLGTGQITPSTLKPNSGEVTLLDTNDNNIYDMIYVKGYDVYTVKAKSGNKIYDRLGRQLNLEDIDDVYVYQDDKEISVDEIQENDVISAMISPSGERAWLYISRETVEGRVDSMYTSNSESVFEIDGEEYRFGYTYAYELNRNNSNTVPLKPGDYRKIYLDIYGEIAFAEVSGADTEYPNYAYLMGAKYREELEDVAYVRLLTLNNKFEVFVSPAGEKIRFGRLSGGKYVIKKEEPDVIVETLQNNTQELVTYELDDDGKLIEICLPGKTKDPEVLSKDSTRYTMPYSNKVVNNKYYVDVNTACFGIPFRGQYEEYLQAGKYNEILSSSNELTLYDIEPDGRIGALICHNSVATRYTESKGEYEVLLDYVNSPILFINSVRTKIDEEGDIVTYASGYELGMEKEVIIGNSVNSNSDPLDVIKQGSAVQYVTNTLDRSRALTADEKERIVVVKKVFDFTIDNPYKSQYAYNDVYVSLLAGVSSTSLDGLVVTHDIIDEISNASIKLNKSDIVFMKNSGIVVMSYSRDSKKFEIADMSDLQIGMDVFVRRRNSNAIEIVYMKD